MSAGIVALNRMAGLPQATALYHQQVFDRSLMRQSVCPSGHLESFSQSEFTQMLPVLLPLGQSSNFFSSTSISIFNSSNEFAGDLWMEADDNEIPPPQLLDEVMDDLENIMDVDEVYGGSERSETVGASEEEDFATLKVSDIELDDSDRMVMDAGQSSPFDVFVEYFASVMCPGSWMDLDLSGCRFSRML